MMPIEKGLGSWAPAGGARVSARHPPTPNPPHRGKKLSMWKTFFFM